MQYKFRKYFPNEQYSGRGNVLEAHDLNFLSEGDRLGLDMKLARMGCTEVYCSFGLIIERSRMTPYHKKLLHVALNIMVVTAVAVECCLVECLLC